MLMIVAVCAAALNLQHTGDFMPDHTSTVAYTSPYSWLPQGWYSFAANIAANVAIAFMLLMINRTYRLMRSITWIFVGLFFVMQLAQPGVLGYFYGGSFMALVMLALTALLFSTYADPALTRSTYLLFFLLTLAALFRYNIIFFLPVFILGTMQMKTFGMRTLLASIMGIVTPLWILLGFGLLTVDMLHMPVFEPALPDTDTTARVTSLATTAFTGGLGLIFTCANLMKVMSYNSARRAFNGFLTLLFLTTIILIIADHTNYLLYIPLLNTIAAYQTGHFFATRRYRLSYIPVGIILIIYGTLAAIPALTP